MRLHKIKIECYNKEESDLLGTENAGRVESEAVVDLDKITWFYNNGADEFFLMFDSGDSILCTNHTVDSFAKLMNGKLPAHV